MIYKDINYCCAIINLLEAMSDHVSHLVPTHDFLNMGLTRTALVRQDAEATHKQGRPQDVAGHLRMRPITRMVITGTNRTAAGRGGHLRTRLSGTDYRSSG